MESDPAEDLAAEILLLKEIASGNRRSFEAFYDRFSRILFATAFRVLNNQEAAEDVLQDAFVQIWQKAPLFDPEKGRPLTWAVTLTRNKALDRLRSTQRRNRTQDAATEDAQAFEQFDDRSAFDIVAAGESGRLGRDSWNKLSEDQRTVIEMAFFSSLTVKEISEQLGEPLGTVKARIRRGMMRLRDLLRARP